MTDMTAASTEPPNADGIFTKRFWLRALERAIKTAAQVLALALTTNGTDVTSLDAKQTAIIVVSGFFLSIATSVASTPFGNTDSNNPSLVK